MTENGFRGKHLQQIRDATVTDQSLIILGELILMGWPNHNDSIPMEALPNFNYREEPSIRDEIIHREDLVVASKTLRLDMKNRVHAGYVGIN